MPKKDHSKLTPPVSNQEVEEQLTGLEMGPSERKVHSVTKDLDSGFDFTAFVVLGGTHKS